MLLSGSTGKCYAPSCRGRKTFADLVRTRGRRFALDLSPRLFYARGDLVQLLIAANIGRYLDFKAVPETFILRGKSVRPVPCSKRSMFLDRSLSPKDKRLLSRFLQTVLGMDFGWEVGVGRRVGVARHFPTLHSGWVFRRLQG